MIKGSINQEDMTIIYVSKIRAYKYIKQTDKSERRKSNSIIEEDFNTPLSIMRKTSNQKINKEIEDLNNTLYRSNGTIGHMHLQNILPSSSRICITIKHA
jgi:hypothetical protein